MVALVGTYQNGFVKFEKEFVSTSPFKVIVTFLDDDYDATEKTLSLSDFSFAQSQKNLQNFQGSLSDAVIEERRKEL